MLIAQTYLSVLSAFNYANLNYKNVNIKFQQNIKRTTCSWTPDTKPIVGNLMQNGKKGKNRPSLLHVDGKNHFILYTEILGQDSSFN